MVGPHAVVDVAPLFVDVVGDRIGQLVRGVTEFDWLVFLEVTLSGIGLGSLYALVAIGFSLIYKVTDVLNFAQGQIGLVGAYGVVIFIAVLGLSPWAAVVATIITGIALGVVLERGVFRWFIGEPVLSVIIVTLALMGVFQGLIKLAPGGGPNFRGYPDTLLVDWSVPLPYGVSLSGEFAIGVVLAFAVMALLMAFFRYTVMGAVLRASASDEQAAMALGISIERNIMIAWTISIVVTVIGGMLLAMSRGGAGMAIEHVGIVILAAVILGGLDSIPGAFIGSLVVGLLEEWGSFYVDPVVGQGFGQILPLVFLLVTIVVLPYGLFGTERIERL